MACCLASNSLNAQSEQAFSSHTIDLGCVVSDVDKAVAFYTQAIGFKQVSGFSVPGDYASKVGLTDGKMLDIKAIAGGSQELPASLGKGVYLTIVRDPDGNFVELVGPKS